MKQDIDFYGSTLTRSKQPANLSRNPLRAQRAESGVSRDTPLSYILGLMRRYFRISEGIYESEEGCRQAVLDATNMCLQYGLTPGYHVYVRRSGNEWIADAGYRAWMDCANAAAAASRFAWDIQLVELDDEEIIERSEPGQFTSGDIGYAARVLRSDKAALYQHLSADYNPPLSYGFWHEKGYPEHDDQGQPTGAWAKDPIFHGRDKYYTARMRATKAAVMDSFSLIPLDNRTPSERAQALLNLLEAELHERNRPADPRASALMVETDHDPLWA